MLPENSFEVTVSDVSITTVGFAIFLKPVEKTTSKVVPIFIGPLETHSISTARDGVVQPRPNTHDLMINMLKEMNAKILYVLINDIVGNIFYARIVVQQEDSIFTIDARPSDSVAIALRARCTIYMDEKVFQDASVIVGEDGQAEDAETIEEEEPQSEIEKLKEDLNRAVTEENFEEAARLRDQINNLLREN